MQERVDIRLPRVVDNQARELRRLRPISLEYELTMIPLSTATLVLAETDPVSVGELVELFDTTGSIGLFQVYETKQAHGRGGTITAQLEHALCTIANGVVFGYREFGGTGVNLRSVLLDLLAMQPVKYWTLGACEFDTYYQYSFENENLLTALASLAEPLEQEYLWTFDTTAYPFILNLVKAPTQNASELRMNRNADTVRVSIDKTDLCTRIYPLGYGEGVNQLNIRDVNNGSNHLNADTQGTWGIVNTVYTETTITEAATLKAAARRVLQQLKNPVVTVEVDGTDIYGLTGETLDSFFVGRVCRVPLPDYGIVMSERVVSIKKQDVYGKNTKVALTLANRQQDSVETLSRLSRKTAIGELYSQGATNQYAVHFVDNADSSNPLECEFYIDENAVWINAVTCKFKLDAFRSYSRGAASGGGRTSGGGGGGTSGGGGNISWTNYTGKAVQNTVPSGYTTGLRMAGGTSHDHPLCEHTHSADAAIADHYHTLSEHTHSTPDHTHPDNPGIYRGGSASAVTVTVDGTQVSAGAIVNGEFNAVPYLAKDNAGRITRGAWHSITFSPNALTRIVADLQVKTFIRSISGGNY